MRSRVLGVLCTTAVLIAGVAGLGQSRTSTLTPVLLRVNQVGYLPGAEKVAFALSRRAVTNLRYTVVRADRRVVLAGRIGSTCRRLNARWRGCRLIDFSRLKASGTYRIQVGASTSPPFRIGLGATLFGPLATRAVMFLQAQRDGQHVIPGTLGRRPAHRSDAAARVYAQPLYRGGKLAGPLRPTGAIVDLAGGWFDAGDYLKFSGTASFTDALLLLTLRDYGASLPNRSALLREARFGTDWLLKTWDERRKILFEQVGLGDGNGSSVLGDHDIWRLPQRDGGYRARSLRYVVNRPVFAANLPGAPISPNLAGREAAAFALCAQVFRTSDPAYAHRCLLAGQTLYDAAATSWRGPLAASVPAAYYSETEWHDDMELAAVELYLATLHGSSPDLPHQDPFVYLQDSAGWANAYMVSSTADRDSLNLYDVTALANYDLYRAMVASGHTTDLATNATNVIGDLRDQLNLAVRLAGTGALGLADPATPTDTVAHALGYAVEAHLYEALGGGSAYRSVGERQLSWVLGANPWGSSFVVGAGSLYPHCLSHQVANLSGSLDGTRPILAGAVVDGPTGDSDVGALGAPDGFRPCSARAGAFGSLGGHGLRYLDDVRSSGTSEPSDDLAAMSLLAFAQQAAAAPPTPLTVARDARRATAGPARSGRHWLVGVTISEYWPVPERWFRGALVSAPGIPGRHRVDWLYSGTGLVMEGDGITLGSQRVHVDSFGRERWVNARGRETAPTAGGVWTHGDPAWRVGGWRNRAGAVTFPLGSGGWSNGRAVHYAPVPGVRFARGPSLPLTPYRSVAVDPRLIPAGSRIYIPAYRRANGGWFVAQDTGSGIIGRHVDVFRLPPPSPNGGRFLQGQRILVVPPPRGR
jgi:endoglucanase